MLLEVAKPIALTLCLLSLGAVFYTAFLVPSSDLEQKTWDSLVLLSFAAGICLTSGMIFREPAARRCARAGCAHCRCRCSAGPRA